MNKNPKNIVRSIISKSGKILRHPLRKKTLVDNKESFGKKKKFARIKKIRDRIRSAGVKRKKGEAKIARAWNRDFQGSFDHSVRKTAEFIRKRKRRKTA
jgi:hypothetical protein